MPTAKKREREKSDAGWLAIGVLAAVCLACLFVRLVLDALSPAGLAYAVGLGNGAGLMFPRVSAFVTWAVIAELCAVAGMAGNYLAGRWKSWWLANWFAGHVRVLVWIWTGLRCLARSVRVLRPARDYADQPSASDFEGFVVDTKAA